MFNVTFHQWFVYNVDKVSELFVLHATESLPLQNGQYDFRLLNPEYKLQTWRGLYG